MFYKNGRGKFSNLWEENSDSWDVMNSFGSVGLNYKFKTLPKILSF